MLIINRCPTAHTFEVMGQVPQANALFILKHFVVVVATNIIYIYHIYNQIYIFYI